jgi:hypothetical protein
MDDSYSYLDSLTGGRHLPLSGNPPRHSNQEFDDEQRRGGAFATTPPDFNGGTGNRSYRTRSSNNRTGDTQSSRFRNQQEYNDPREKYWKNNHSVSKHEDWGSLVGQFPTIAPIGEHVTVKNAIFNTLAERVEINSGNWPDKTEFFMGKFEDIVPAAKLQANMAIEQLDDIRTDAFAFGDMELLDASLALLPRGNANAEFSQAARDRTRYIRFTLTVRPRLINPGVMDVDPATFPAPTSTTVYVRALMDHGSLAPGITKNLLDTTPKLLVFFYTQAHTEFDISIKYRSDAAPDQEKYAKWLRDVKSKTKFFAGKHYIQQSYVGRLEGTETLGQRLTSIKQRTFDTKTQQATYLSVQELHQQYQFLLVEIKTETNPADIPQLDRLFVQAVSEDLRIKLLSHLQPNPSTTNHANVQRLTDLVQHAIEAEKDLQTITNIADRAAHRSARPYNSRQTTQQRPGPRTFYGGAENMDEYPSEQDMYPTNPFCNAHDCEPIAHSSGTIVMPKTFMAKYNQGISGEQQDLMAQAIIAMGLAIDCLAGDDTPFTGASIVEEALQKSSGVRIPIKCFGCDGIPKFTDNAFHLWRDCPNKGEKEVWENFEKNLKEFRERKQARMEQKRNQGGGSQYGSYGPRSMTTDGNWERLGFPSKHVHDQIQAIADEKNTASTRMTLLASLKDSLEEYKLDTEPPKIKKAKWGHTGRKGPGRSFLMYMSPTTNKGGPKTMLGAPPKDKYPFRIAYKLPFIAFPIGDGRTAEDVATLSGLLDTGGCCNMGWLTYHKAIASQYPQLVDEFVCLEEERYETISIGGLKDGVTITHMIRYTIPFIDKGEQCYITLGLTEDLPIDTLFGLGFQQETKMKIDFGSKKVESAFLQKQFEINFKEPRRTNPEQIRSEENNTPKSLLTTDE